MAYKANGCPGLDSNQHTSRRRHLKTVRLPISPPGHREECKYKCSAVSKSENLGLQLFSF